MPDDDPLTAALDAKQTTNADVDAATEGGILDGETVRFNAKIPANLRDRFSSLCRRKGRTMTSVVQEWMFKAVKAGTIDLDAE